MTANRDELVHLIDGMPHDQVEVLLEDARRLAGDKPRGTWPPKFFGMIYERPNERVVSRAHRLGAGTGLR